jgi:hypothetical protein
MLPADDDPEADAGTDKRAQENGGKDRKQSFGPLNGAASEKQRSFLTNLLKDAKLAPNEKSLVNDFLYQGSKAWQKQQVSDAITWIKEDKVPLLLQAAGVSDVPADMEGLSEHDASIEFPPEDES